MAGQIDPDAFETSKRITEQDFPLVRRGYDPAAVSEFLATIADQVVRLEDELARQRTEIRLLERRTGSAEEAVYLRIARQVAHVLRAADDAAAAMRAEAEAAAESSMARAREQAARLRAEVRAEIIRSSLGSRADGTVGETPQLDLEFDLSSIDLDPNDGQR